MPASPVNMTLLRCVRRLPVAAAVAAFAIPTAARAHGNTPVLVQVTRNTLGEIQRPWIRSEAGDSIVFVSDGDVLGPGTAPGHREVYYYSVPAGTITRLTNTVDGESYGAARETDSVHSSRPLVVAFISTGDLDPSIGNADHNPEVFIRVTATGQIMQVTDTQPPVVNAEPYTSESGKCVVFRSSADLDDNTGSDPDNPGAGFHNPDGSDEIFNVTFGDSDFGRGQWVTTQVSNGPAGTTSSHPVVGGYWFSRQCRSNAYQSTADQLGNGSSGTHIYNYTRTTGTIEQLSQPGFGNNLDPAMSSASNFARGPFVFYESDMDPIGNGSTVFEMFRFRLFKNELWQYTFADRDSSRGGISDGGGRTVFQSKADLFDPRAHVPSGDVPPFNSDGNSEIFLTVGKHQIIQVTRTENCENTDPTLRDLGDAITFRSTCDLIPGLNPGGVAQVFYYVLVDGSDPLATAAGCSVADGCCNQDNGCLGYLFGRKLAPPREAIRPDYSGG